MSRFFNNQNYIVNGDMSNAVAPDSRSTATIVGPWIRLTDLDSIGIQEKWTGVATTGTFGFEINDDEDPNVARSVMGPKAITPTADITAAAPAGGTSGSASINLVGANMPRAKWGRFVYTRTSGGSAAALQAAVNGRGT